MVDIVSFTQQIDNQASSSDIERAIATAFKTVFESQFGDRFRDMVDYGSPQLGSETVVERFSKQDGLLVLRRTDTANILMQLLYANWLSTGSKRGLNYLEFALNMVWGSTYTIQRLFHSIPLIESYPLFLTTKESDDTFLTSRIMVSIKNSVDLSEVSELAPMLRRLVPANIVANITSDLVQTDDTFNVGMAIVGTCFNVVDLS
ncbi:MAG: hypothetical protein [Bacteriophage sp.]|nr:MAG: hypothetical protein [Bacteriophage sp.]